MFAVLRANRVVDGLPDAVLVGERVGAESPHLHVVLAGRRLPVLLLREVMRGGAVRIGRKSYSGYENISAYEFYCEDHQNSEDIFSMTFTARATNLIFQADKIFATDFNIALSAIGVESPEHYDRRNGVTYFLGSPVKKTTEAIDRAVRAFEEKRLQDALHN